MKWPWQQSSYNTKTYGAYAITAHPVETRDSLFFIAWHKTDQLGTFDSFDAAEGACVAHSEAA